MSIFSAIMNKIFHAATGDAGTTAPDAVPLPGSAPGAAPGAASDAPMASTAAASTPLVDVGAVLAQMAAGKGGGGNYQASIIDLLKLLDLDSSLDARKQLAGELDVHAGADGSAEENIALHKAVMIKLAENGGKIPDGMRG